MGASWPRERWGIGTRHEEVAKIVIGQNNFRFDLIRRVWSASLSKELGAYFMTGFQAKLERFESLATECELIARRVGDGGDRELYLRLRERYRAQASDMRALIATINAAA